MFFFFLLLKILILIILILISVAFFTLAERKVLGAMQRRKGPNVIGFYGLLQPLADGLKLFMKESIFPGSANKYIFFLAPIGTFFLSLMGWVVITFDEYAFISGSNIGFLYLLAISSLNIYGVILSGWSSNSKYAFLGSLRSTAQMISYEVALGFILITVCFCTGSFDLQEIVAAQKKIWFVFLFAPLASIFFISGLAETNRHPFDLPEAEAELVSGYNVEYSGMPFALFSLAEYSNMLLMSSMNVILFFGGWLPLFSFLNFIPGFFWFSIKICFFVYLYIAARGALPRFRYDQLMLLGWKIFLPLSLAYLILTFSLLISFNFLPF